MKFRRLICIAAATIFSLMVISPQLAGEETAKHHHYKLIDMGSLGGPDSYVNGFEYFGAVQYLNNAGALVGWADLSKRDPYCKSGNDYSSNFCFNYEQTGVQGRVSHAFQWQHGIRTDLGTLPGGLSSATAWVSTNGLIAGTSQNGETDPVDPGFPDGFPEDRAVLWRDGKIIDLGILPEGGFESGAQSVNSRGQVVGWAYNTVFDPHSMAFWSPYYNFYSPAYFAQLRAFLWQDGVMQDLGTLGTGNDAYAMGINEQGQVIGISYTNSTPTSVPNGCTLGEPVPTQDPFLWENGTMTDLGTFGGDCGVPLWINNDGHVVGFSSLSGDQTWHPFLWTKANGMQDLGTLTPGGVGTAVMINDFGVVAGGASTANFETHAFLWDGTIHDLGTVDGSNCSWAWAINRRMQVVGNSGYNCNTKAFLWEHAGPMVNLGTLISPKSNWSDLGVRDINDQGEVGGVGMDPSGQFRAILLIPCDENHPGVEGCDYSMIDAASEEVAGLGSGEPETQSSPAAAPSRPIYPMPRDSGRPILGVRPQ